MASTPVRITWLNTPENTCCAGSTAAGKFSFLIRCALSRIEVVALARLEARANQATMPQNKNKP